MTRNNKYFNILYLLLVLFISSYIIYTRVGDGLYQLIQWVLVAGLLIFSIPYIKRPKSAFITMLIIFVLYMFAGFVLDGGGSTTYMKDLFICLFAAVPFYVYKHDEKYFTIFYWLLLFVSIIKYAIVRQDHLLIDENSYGGGSIVGCLIPLTIYALKNYKESIKTTICLILVFVVITSAKRGDIIIAVASFVTYYLFHLIKMKKFRFGTVLFFLLAISVSWYFIKQYYESSYILQVKLEQTQNGDSSQRDVLYNSIYTHFKSSSTYEQLFGNGFDGSNRIVGSRAHSDWLEMLIDGGIIGVFLYLLLFIFFYREIRKTNDDDNRFILYSILISWLLGSIYSMYIFDSGYCVYLLVIGCILCDNRNYHSELLSRKNKY